MSERTIWTCDGCGEEKVVTGGRNGDWNSIVVTLSGFSGYPVGIQGNGNRAYHLCPACQNYLFGVANPRCWPRPSGKTADEGDPSQ